VEGSSGKEEFCRRVEGGVNWICTRLGLLTEFDGGSMSASVDLCSMDGSVVFRGVDLLVTTSIASKRVLQWATFAYIAGVFHNTATFRAVGAVAYITLARNAASLGKRT
jgi:hypothetical protein